MLAVLPSASKVSLCLLCFSVVVTFACSASISPSRRDEASSDDITSTTADDGIYEMGLINEPTEGNSPSLDISQKQPNLPAASSSPGLPAATFIVCNQLNVANLSELNLLGKITIINKFIGIQQPRYQATMLSKLDTRFRSAGYMNIQFAFVYPLAEQRKRSNGSADAVPQSLLSASVQHKLIVISDPSQSTDLQKLISGATYVIDPCGRLAYIIYFPWSSIQNPFVKAAILSTVYDAPCGPCHIESQHSPLSKMTGTTSVPIPPTYAKPLNYFDNETQSIQSTNLTISNIIDNETAIDSNNKTVTLENNTQTQDLQKDNITSNITEAAANASSSNRLDSFIHRNNFTDEENSSPEDKAYVIPIRVILPIEHAHAQPRTSDNDLDSTYLKYNYLMLKTNDINYHEHLDTDRPEKLKALNNSLQSLDLVEQTILSSEVINDTESLGRYIINNEEHHIKKDNTTSSALPSTNSNTTTDTGEAPLSAITSHPEQMFVGEDGVRYKALSRDSVPKEFNYLNLVQVRSDEDVSDLEAERNMPPKQQQPEGGYTEKSSGATAYDIEQDQLEDRHYKKILPWIHFRL